MSSILQHDKIITDQIWQHFAILADSLDATDDAELWKVAVGQIIGDAQYLISQSKDKKQSVIAEIGRCSHWMRPHQSRWTADGGFAAPLGYSGPIFSSRALPEYDWSLKWQWQPDDLQWVETEKSTGKRRSRLRVAIPSRTARHNQAAIHTVWIPRPPVGTDDRAIQLYGFRMLRQVWKLRAHLTRDKSLYATDTA